MSVVAVAGGTGQLGRSIVETLLKNGNYKVIILARKANQAAQEEIGAPVIPLNYGNVNDITSVLEAYNVHTLISTIVTLNGTEPELNLIKAADKSAATKRFVPSYWATDYPAQFRDTFFVAKNKFEALDALESTSLEYTAFVFGYFLDYFVAPYIKSHLYPTALYIDAANNTAAVPGSGDVMNQFIYSLDVARFVVAALSLPKWEKKSFIIGDRITWNQFVTALEEAKGTKFKVSHDTRSSLASGSITDLPGHNEIYKTIPREKLRVILSLYGVMFADGAFDFTAPYTLNMVFPEIKLRTVRELVKEAWGMGQRYK